MTSNSYRNKIITIALLIIMSLAAAYFLTTPQWNQNKALKIQLTAAQEQETKLTESLSLVQTFIGSYNSSSESVALADLTFPAKTPDTANLVSSLQDLAAASGVVLAEFQTEERAQDRTSQPHSIQVLRVNLSASGTYLAFEDFILRLEHHMRLIDIEKISLASEESGLLRYDLSLKTYYQK